MDKTRLISIVTGLLAAVCMQQPGFSQEALRREGNSVRLISDGKDFYRELSSAFEGATKFICFEYFSVGQDSVSTAILSQLQRKAAEGVAVYAMIDDYGIRHRGFPMDDAALEDYRSRGLDIAIFNPMSVNTPLPRDHRKLSVVDGVTAFVGGMNICDEQVHHTEKFGTVHDFSVRLDGPVAGLLAEEFEKVWNSRSGGRRMALPEIAEAEWTGTVSVRVCPTEGWECSPTVRKLYQEAIDSADSTIVLVNAYPMPSSPILHALKSAAMRGVRVEIVTGDRTDLPKVLRRRPMCVLESLSRQENIRVSVVEDSFIHAKAMSVDSKSLLLGSANLDYLSRTTNLELCVMLEDAEIASQYEMEVLSLGGQPISSRSGQ